MWKPKMTIQVPHGVNIHRVTVYSLADHDPAKKQSRLAYLQLVRTSTLTILAGGDDPESTQLALEYHADKLQFAEDLANMLPSGPPAGILCVPSTRDLTRIYFDSIRRRFAEALDLTSTVGRKGKVKGGESTSYDEILADTTCAGSFNLRNIGALLMVDDVFDSGRTVAALVTRLHGSGLPQDSQIDVASPLCVSGDKWQSV